MFRSQNPWRCVRDFNSLNRFKTYHHSCYHNFSIYYLFGWRSSPSSFFKKAHRNHVLGVLTCLNLFFFNLMIVSLLFYSFRDRTLPLCSFPYIPTLMVLFALPHEDHKGRMLHPIQSSLQGLQRCQGNATMSPGYQVVSSHSSIAAPFPVYKPTQAAKKNKNISGRNHLASAH